jgi:hypothetical protein
MNFRSVSRISRDDDAPALTMPHIHRRVNAAERLAVVSIVTDPPHTLSFLDEVC